MYLHPSAHRSHYCTHATSSPSRKRHLQNVTSLDHDHTTTPFPSPPASPNIPRSSVRSTQSTPRCAPSPTVGTAIPSFSVICQNHISFAFMGAPDLTKTPERALFRPSGVKKGSLPVKEKWKTGCNSRTSYSAETVPGVTS